MSDMKIHFVVSPAEYAQGFGRQCIKQWGETNILKASYVVSIGGDGTALVAEQEALSAYLLTGQILPVYVIDYSNTKEHVGALTNKGITTPQEIEGRIKEARKVPIYPLQADCILQQTNEQKSYFGINEITVKISRYEMTYMDVDILSKGKVKDSFYVAGDGIVIATPMGKTAYYHNLGGKSFQNDRLGLQTIAAKKNINKIIPDNHQVAIWVRSAHRPTCVMRDCNLSSPPIVSSHIYKSKVPLTILKDRVRD